MLLHETVGNVKKVASEGTRNLCHVQKPVVAARPGKDFPWCAVPNLGSTRSQRHETIAGCSAQSHSKNLRSCPQPPDSHIAGSGKHSYYTQAVVVLA
ncbi:Proteinase inhibitor type-2 [Trichinella spiralis]|uniref:Proteinase inhibitor type-2 n=1 Tax=Trichinella spiralis TaxID=6334 RepID=A0ABR3L2T7_TRISP